MKFRILKGSYKEKRVRFGRDDFFKAVRLIPGSSVPSAFTLIPRAEFGNDAPSVPGLDNSMRPKRETSQQASGNVDGGKDAAAHENTASLKQRHPTSGNFINKNEVARSTATGKPNQSIASEVSTKGSGNLERNHEGQKSYPTPLHISKNNKRDLKEPLHARSQPKKKSISACVDTSSSLRAEKSPLAEVFEPPSKSKECVSAMSRKPEPKQQLNDKTTSVLPQESKQLSNCVDLQTNRDDIVAAHTSLEVKVSDAGSGRSTTEETGDTSKLASKGTGKASEYQANRRRVVKATSAGGRRRYEQRKRKK